MSTDSDTTLSGPVQTLIQRHLDFMAELPGPDETFAASDIDDPHANALTSMERRGIVRQVERERYDNTDAVASDGVKYRWRYRLTPAAARVRDELLADRDTICPCGHGGVRNCGDHYVCLYEPCDRQFERDELDLEVMK